MSLRADYIFDPIFKVTGGLRQLILLCWFSVTIFVCVISLEPMVGILPNLHGYIMETSLRVDKILGTLNHFKRAFAN